MRLSGVLSVTFIFFISLSASGAAKQPLVKAKAACVYDIVSGVFIYGKNSSARMYPASTVKLLTAMVVLDKWDPEHKISVPGSVVNIEPYKLYLKKGEVYTVRDMLYGLLMRSANDIAHVFAMRVSGSEAKFGKLMTKKARFIGARYSIFKNPHGLPDPEQNVTARDMAVITAYSRNYPLIREILSTKEKSFPGPGKGTTRMKNRNRLLMDNFTPVIIGKTGYTKSAGRCFAGCTVKTENPVAIVIYNSPARWDDLKKLVLWSEKFYRTKIQANKLMLHKQKITECQKILKKIGFYSGEVNGEFGRDTLSAVLKFQTSSRLKVDGIIGPKTLAMIYLHSKTV